MAIDFDSVNECGQCGYDLTGLPSQGRCPECGNVYDIDTSKGLTRDPSIAPRRVWFVKHIRTLVIIAMAICAYGCCGGMSLIARTPGKAQATGTFIAMLLGIAAIASYVGEKADERSGGS